jgi:hypothetical protein
VTIVVGIATPDGIVLAADSRTTLLMDAADPSSRTRISSDSAEKVFLLCDRFAVATFGDAFVGEQTIAGLMSVFIAQLEETPADGHGLARALGAFFAERYARARTAAGAPVGRDEPTALGFLVAGYDSGGIGHLYETRIPGPEVEEYGISTASIGMVPRGQTDVIDRLLRGYDALLLDGLDVELPTEIQHALDQLAYTLMIPITLQDGVDFARFLIRTTIDMQRFSDGTYAFSVGVPDCGGPTTIAVVRRAGVDWVAAPALRADVPAGRAEGSLGG